MLICRTSLASWSAWPSKEAAGRHCTVMTSSAAISLTIREKHSPSDTPVTSRTGLQEPAMLRSESICPGLGDLPESERNIRSSLQFYDGRRSSNDSEWRTG